MNGNEGQKDEFTRSVERGLLAVAGASVGCALLHVLFPTRFDEKTAMFLALAVVAPVIQQITKFKGFGIEIEKEVTKLKQDVKTVEAAFRAIGSIRGLVDGVPPYRTLSYSPSIRLLRSGFWAPSVRRVELRRNRAAPMVACAALRPELARERVVLSRRSAVYDSHARIAGRRNPRR